MKTVLMNFVTEQVSLEEAKELRAYTYDTQEENLVPGDVYKSPSYGDHKFLQVFSIVEKDPSQALPKYVMKEIVVGDAPAIPVVGSNIVYCKKVN